MWYIDLFALLFNFFYSWKQKLFVIKSTKDDMKFKKLLEMQ
jgi:hypothetical protein